MASGYASNKLFNGSRRMSPGTNLDLIIFVYSANVAYSKVAEIAINFKGTSGEFHSMIARAMRESLAHRWPRRFQARRSRALLESSPPRNSQPKTPRETMRPKQGCSDRLNRIDEYIRIDRFSRA
jgi:hypothetical protein